MDGSQHSMEFCSNPSLFFWDRVHETELHFLVEMPELALLCWIIFVDVFLFFHTFPSMPTSGCPLPLIWKQRRPWSSAAWLRACTRCWRRPIHIGPRTSRRCGFLCRQKWSQKPWTLGHGCLGRRKAITDVDILAWWFLWWPALDLDGDIYNYEHVVIISVYIYT